MRSITLIIACIVIIILVISTYTNIQQNKKNLPASANKKPLKDACKLLPAEGNIWPVHNY